MAKVRVWTNKEFWLDTVERVVSTAAQAAVGVLVAGGLIGLATSAGWIVIGSAAAASLLKAVAAAFLVSGDDSVSPASFASTSETK